MDKLLTLLIIVGVIVGVAYVMTHGAKRIETRECQEWLKEKADFPLFQAADWQVEQCNTFNINLEN